MSDYMPDDVLTSILAHLPAKSLVRFTCVCKSWQSLITSSNFITTHLNVQTKLSNNDDNSSRLILIRYCPRLPYNDRASLHVDNGTFDLCEKLNFPSFEPRFRVLGSCNGLIFFSNAIMGTTLMLWNPSIRKSMILPRPPDMYLNHTKAFGFGFDSQTNDYKVVRLVFRKPKWFVKLYKLSTSSWETITATFDPEYFIYPNHLVGFFINDAVHWTVFKTDSFRILSFNMRDEEFNEIMPPANLYVKHGFHIAACKKWLSLFHIPHYKYCSVWVMKEYGVVESWTKLYTLDMEEEKLRKPLGFRKNGELILEKVNKELVSYDSETQQIKNLGTFYCCRREHCYGDCEFRYYVVPYVESLELDVNANRLGSKPSKESSLKNKKRHFQEI